MGAFEKFNNPSGIDALLAKLKTIPKDTQNTFLNKLKDSDPQVYSAIIEKMAALAKSESELASAAAAAKEESVLADVPANQASSIVTTSAEPLLDEVEISLIQNLRTEQVASLLKELTLIQCAFILKSLPDFSKKTFLRNIGGQQYKDLCKLLLTDFKPSEEKLLDARLKFRQVCKAIGVSADKNAPRIKSRPNNGQNPAQSKQEMELYARWDEIFGIKNLIFLFLLLNSVNGFCQLMGNNTLEKVSQRYLMPEQGMYYQLVPQKKIVERQTLLISVFFHHFCPASKYFFSRIEKLPLALRRKIIIDYRPFLEPAAPGTLFLGKLMSLADQYEQVPHLTQTLFKNQVKLDKVTWQDLVGRFDFINQEDAANFSDEKVPDFLRENTAFLLKNRFQHVPVLFINGLLIAPNIDENSLQELLIQESSFAERELNKERIKKYSYKSESLSPVQYLINYAKVQKLSPPQIDLLNKDQKWQGLQQEVSKIQDQLINIKSPPYLSASQFRQMYASPPSLSEGPSVTSGPSLNMKSPNKQKKIPPLYFFSDFSCPYCRRQLAELQWLKKKYPQLDIEYKYQVILSSPAASFNPAKIAFAAEKSEYFGVLLQYLYDFQNESSQLLPKSICKNISGLCRDLGGNLTAAIAEKSKSFVRQIETNTQEAEKLNIHSVPTLVFDQFVSKGFTDRNTLDQFFLQVFERAQASR